MFRPSSKALISKETDSDSFLPVGYFQNPDEILKVEVHVSPAGAEPTDISGGLTDVTATVESTSPLSGRGSLRISKPGGNRQGVSVAINFDISEADQGRLHYVNFDYLADANFVVGSSTADSVLTVFVWDRTNSRLVHLADRKLYAKESVATFSSSFQASADSTAYRLIFFIGTTDTDLWELILDSIRVSRSALIPGTIVTDWQAFPSVAAGTLITATTTNPTYGTVTQNVALWRRVGDSMEIIWTFRQSTSGSSGSGTYLFNLPPGYQIDTTKLPASMSNIQPIGTFNYADSNSSFGNGWVSPYSATQLWAHFPYTTSGGGAQIASPWGSATSGFIATSPMSLSIRVTVPIAGWGSTVQSVFTGDDGRVIAAAYWQTSNANSDTSTPIAFGGKDFDTHNAVSLSPFRFTAPISSIYRIGGTLNSSDTNRYVSLYKNGVSYKTVGYINTTGTTQLSGQIFLAAGEYIDVRTNSLTTIVGNASQNNIGNSHITIERVSGNAVAAVMTGGGNTAFTSTTSTPSSSSTTWVQALTQSFTPKSPSSKITIRGILNLTYATDNSIAVGVRILKNGTPIHTVPRAAQIGIGTSLSLISNVPIEFTEDAGTVAARTYSIEFNRSSYAGGYGGTVTLNPSSGISTLKIVEEIQ